MIVIQLLSNIWSFKSSFNDKMKQYVEDQQEEVCKALIGIDRYTLRKEYCYLAVNSNVWFISFFRSVL